MKRFFLPTANSPAYQWLGLLLFLLLFSVCLGGFIVWLKAMKSAGGKRKRKHRHRRPTNPTLAQTGGLPRKRDPDQPPPGP